MTRPYHLSEIAENLRRGDGMPDIDQLLRALFLVALLLYLIPAVFRLGSSAEGRRWFQHPAIAGGRHQPQTDRVRREDR
jgi:hypothetical protein